MLRYLLLSIITCALAQSAANLLQADPTTRANAGAAFESAQHADNLLAFYDVPANFSQSLAPGVLLSAEDATPMLNYTVPAGLTMSRIIYTTSDVNGTTLPASAYVLWPYTLPDPEKGFDAVAWAHGTSGFFRPCAPSNYRSLQYHFMVPYTLALQGFAVIAPDYAGLGIDTLPSGQKFHHPWVVGAAQANDLANAVLAARQAFPQVLQPDGSFVVMGHSQGGRAAWAFAERQAKQPIAGYMGTVAIAPPVRFIDQVEMAMANTSEVYAYSTLPNQYLFMDSISTVFPSYNYSGLTDLAYDRWHNQVARVQGCLPTSVLSFFDIPPDQIVKPGWTKDSLVQAWDKLSGVGNKEFVGPLLIIVAEFDAIVSLDFVENVAKETCEMSQKEAWNQSIEVTQYSAVSHFSVIQASQKEWLEWIQRRLRGTRGLERRDGEKREKSGMCAVRTVEGYRAIAASAALGTAPNFFVEWFDFATEFWKYVP